MYAPIYYDSNDTGFYVDPNSTSVISTVRASNWFRAIGETGLYSHSYGQHFYAKSSGDYWAATGDGSSQGGIVFYQNYESSLRGYVYWDGDGFGLLHSAGGWAVRTTTSYSEIPNATRSPVYYDSSNTGYYADPASTSQFNEATFAGYVGVGGVAPSTNMSGTSGISIYNANYPSVGFATASGPNYLIYRLGSGGALTVWNSSTSETAYFYTGYTQFTGSARAPLFYDSNDTGYYTDPASTSQFSTVNLNGTLSTGDVINIGGSQLGSVATANFRGIEFHTAGNRDYYIGKPAGSWTQPLHIYFYTGTRIYSHQSYDNGTSIYNISSGNIQASFGTGGDNVYLYRTTYAPIIYDYNNTAYYADLNTTGDSIRAAGNITAYYSDMRLKTHLGKIENALEKVNKLEGFYYEANEIAQKLGYKPKREVGVSAQDVQEVLPEIVADAPINSNYLTIDYERLTPLLIEAIKEQNKEVVDLRARVAMLESLISKLIDV
jgi:hypothetical protein